MNNRKRLLAAAAIAALLALDGLAAYRLGARVSRASASADMPASVEARDPLDQFRLEREQLRAREAAQLNEIIYNEKSEADVVRMAQEQLLDLMNRADQEMTLEGLLRGRGFEDALVSVSGRSANVLIRKETVTRQESAVILELVMRETGLTGGNVKIIPIK